MSEPATVSGNVQANVEKAAFDAWFGESSRSVANNINTISDQDLRERYRSALRKLADDYLALPWKNPVGSQLSFNRDSDGKNSIGTMILLRQQALGIDETQAKRDIVAALARYIGVSERAVLDYVSGDKIVHGALPVIVSTAVIVGALAKIDGMTTDKSIKYGLWTAGSTFAAIEFSSWIINGKFVGIPKVLSIPSVTLFK